MSKLPLITNKRPKEMEAWQDCQWLRGGCEKNSCPICGKVKRAAEKFIKAGKDRETFESILDEFVSSNFLEMIESLQAKMPELSKDEGKELQRLEESVPSPDDFPLHNKIMEWRMGIYDIAEESDVASSAWLTSEAGEDLMWYMNSLNVKVYRQLSNLWDKDNNNPMYSELDYQYTGYVLGIVLDIIKKALDELSTDGNVHSSEFNIARISFAAIEEEIRNYHKK